MISSANETKPDTAKVRRTRRRTSGDGGAAAIVGASTGGGVAAGAADAWAPREMTADAPTAMSRLMIAAIRNAHEMPSCGIIQMPATSVPDTAPAVLPA